MRIVSLVPNATEILFALGAGDLVVGVSHECDHPPAARRLPQLTASALAPGLDPAAVDQAVSAQLREGRSLYRLDEARLRELDPDVVFTQELCPVCAVSGDQVAGAVGELPRCPRVVSLDPRRLADVLADIVRVAEVVGRRETGEALVADLERRLAAARRATAGSRRPRVAALEWLDPPYVAGHWIPEMIAAAGGEDVLARPGEGSRRSDWREIAAADPDVLVVMPCGFDAEGSRAQVARLDGEPGWRALRAVREGQVLAVDANGCFSRPGPRLVDGVATLAAAFAAWSAG